MATAPAKLLRVNLSGVSVAATYSGAEPYVGNAIRWNATLGITAQAHSDPTTTPAANFYDGRNVVVGDCIASTSGRLLRIFSISAQTAGTVTCVLEDLNRENTFLDENQNGDGLIPSGVSYLFGVGSNGIPILYPLPSALVGTFPPTFAVQILSRFLRGITFGGGSGTVTGITAGAGLSGGTINISGTLSVATGGVTDAMLAGSISDSKLSTITTANKVNVSAIGGGTLAPTLMPAFTGDITTTAGGVNTTLASVATAGTYKSVTIDAKGRVLAGTNPNTLAGYGITDAQALDPDLTAIAALSGTGTLKRTGVNTWTLDPASYLMANQTITLSGDVTGSGATAITTVLANQAGLSNGQYTKVTVNTKGLVTAATNIDSTDIITYLGYTPLNSSGGTVAGSLIVGGNLTLNGTTSTLNATTVTVDDPVITLGGDTAPGADDNKDRGVEYRWHNGTTSKLGFFGFDDSTGFFTFIPDATNTSEVFSGTVGVIDAARITGSAASLTTTRSIMTSGDASWTVNFNGTTDVTAPITINNQAVTLAKMADVATGTLFYRKSAGFGAPEVQSLATLKTDLGLTGTNSGDQTITLTGDVTGSGTGSFGTIISNGVVSLAKMSNLAANRIIGNNTGSAATPVALTGTQVTAMLDNFSTSAAGLTPVSPGGTTAFLRADGTWAATPGGGNVTTANGASVNNEIVLFSGSSGTAIKRDNTLNGFVKLTAGVVSSANLIEADIPTLSTAGKVATTALSGIIAAANMPAFAAGDVTSSSGTLVLNLQNSTVTLAKMANLPANRIIGNNTGVSAVPLALTGAEVTAMLSTFVQSGASAAKGLVPAPSTTAGTTAFLREDGTWAVPSTGSSVNPTTNILPFNQGGSFGDSYVFREGSDTTGFKYSTGNTGNQSFAIQVASTKTSLINRQAGIMQFLVPTNGSGLVTETLYNNIVKFRVQSSEILIPATQRIGWTSGTITADSATTAETTLERAVESNGTTGAGGVAIWNGSDGGVLELFNRGAAAVNTKADTLRIYNKDVGTVGYLMVRHEDGVESNTFGAEQLLARVSGIDAKTVGTTNLYTPVSGRQVFITKVILRVGTATGVTGVPTVGIGIAAGEDDIFAATSLTGFNASSKVYVFNAMGTITKGIGSAGDVVKLGIDVAATGTTLNFTADVFGYLI